MSPDPDLTLGESSRAVLKQFAAAASPELALGSVRVLASEIRHLRGCLDRIGRGALGTRSPLPTPLWHGREDIIQRLCGLKD